MPIPTCGDCGKPDVLGHVCEEGERFNVRFRADQHNAHDAGRRRRFEAAKNRDNS